MIIDPYAWHRLPIQHLALVAEDTLSVRVARPKAYRYSAGQYAVVKAPVNGMPLLRQYSFASAPDNDFLEFLIQREPGGAVSNWFHDVAKLGEYIEISQPLGSFTAPTDSRALILIAGRIGVAPFISIIRDHLSSQNSRSLTLLYSARGNEQFCYPELYESIPSILFDTKSSERISTTLLKTHITGHPWVYICGSKQFAEGIQLMLIEAGLPPEYIKRELFTLQ